MRNVTRTFNYTHRRRIRRESVLIRAIPQNHSGELVLERLDVGEFDFPRDAAVILECGSTRTGVIRYEFGPLGSLVLPAKVEYPLNYFDGLNILLKVVDLHPDRRGLILGMCAGLQPESSSSSGSLLPVDYADLGELLWRLRFGPSEGPILEVNLRFKDVYHLEQDADFRATVLPEVVGQIAQWVYRYKDREPESELGEKVAEWKVLLQNWGFDVDNLDAEPDDIQESINELTERFASDLRYATLYIESHQGEEH